MKYLVILLLAFGSVFAYGQGDDLAAKGSSISIDNANSVSVPNSHVTSFDGSSATGTVLITTGVITSGDFQTGAIFDQGGQAVIVVNGSTIFNGTVNSGAAWSRTRNANGSYSYSLSGSITDSTRGRTGAFVLVTATVGPPNVLYQGSTVVSSLDIHLN